MKNSMYYFLKGINNELGTDVMIERLVALERNRDLTAIAFPIVVGVKEIVDASAVEEAIIAENFRTNPEKAVKGSMERLNVEVMGERLTCYITEDCGEEKKKKYCYISFGRLPKDSVVFEYTK